MKKIKFLVGYTFLFFLVWTVYELLFRPQLAMFDTIFLMILHRGLKVLVWTVPVFIILKFVYKEAPLIVLRLTSNLKKGFKWGFLIGAIITAYLLIRSCLLGQFKLNLHINLEYLIGAVILIGITEEVVFRGFILQKLMEWNGFWRSNLITAVLFLLIHYPSWYMNQRLAMPGVLWNSIYLILFSMLQGYLLKKSKSLWSCMLVHSINNLMVVIIGG
ncbi:UNVERIFIED_CONTAM: hypothetical protein Cloal_3218 [Acetivibrio alkalicellulosi]